MSGDSICDVAVVRAVEFYSGIGGLHFSLRSAFPEAVVVAAFDIDSDSNRVYERNTGLTPTKADVGTLSAAFLESLKARIWLLSPPCQPFTRQGLKRDVEDPRCRSFLKLLNQLSRMEPTCGPDFLLLENVVGFERSETRDHMMEAFRSCRLTAVQEYILSPDQLGLPYSRPRYFCLARKAPFSLNAQTLIRELPSTGLPLSEVCRCSGFSVHHGSVEGRRQVTVQEFLGGVAGSGEGLPVEEEFLRKCCDVLNVVSKDSVLLNCFTKSYGGRYFKGTGSLLAEQRAEWIPVVCHLQSLCCKEDGAQEELSQFLEQNPTLRAVPCVRGLLRAGDAGRDARLGALFALMQEMEIRYFSPDEIARLHSFPPDFSFPPDVSRKRRYALLGNSLSVAVVSCLIEHLMHP